MLLLSLPRAVLFCFCFRPLRVCIQLFWVLCLLWLVPLESFLFLPCVYVCSLTFCSFAKSHFWYYTVLVNPIFGTFMCSSNHALGISTKSQSTPDFIGLSGTAIRRERFELQDTASDLLPNERVSGCLKHRICKTGQIPIRYNEDRQKAHYTNVQRCGSVWTCPVCAAQISEKRRIELKTGIDNFAGHVYLLTLTNPHHYGDDLADLLKGQQKALSYLWGDRKSKTHLKNAGKVGHIVATEVTYGDNGWHPHYHILLFLDKPCNIKDLQDFLTPCWQNACKKAGLKIPSASHGVDVKNGQYAAQYASKWGLEHEMTKGHIKKGKVGGLTPFDLLKLARNGDDKFGHLFKVYARAFKGKRQLSWSRGLKSLLKINEISDEDLATETEQQSVEIAVLSYKDFWLLRRYGFRADYLEHIEHDIKHGTNRASLLVDTISHYHVKHILQSYPPPEAAAA